MSSDLYSSKILELSTSIKNIGQIDISANPKAKIAKKVSKICGSMVELALEYDVESDQIVKFVINPKACALGQASASILSNSIIGAKSSEVKIARDAFWNMLKNNGPKIENRFADLNYLEAVQDYPMRHASVMLAWDAAIDALDQYSAAEVQAE